MIDEGIGDGLRFERDVNHLVYASTRRVRFEIPEPVGRTRIETKPAVDAAGVVFVRGD